MNLSLIEKSYINISGKIYDSDFINLANIDNDCIKFGRDTLFLTESQKEKLNSQELKKLNNIVYIFEYHNSFGLIANLDIEEYRKNNIKCHELVLPDVVQGMGANYHIYNSETAPVCITHNEKIELSKFVNNDLYDEKFEFTDIKLYVFSGNIANEILKLYSDIESMYVADGHHRLYTTDMLRSKKDIMCCFYSFDEIEILPIHRVLKDVDSQVFERAKDFIEEFMEIVDSNNLEKGYVRVTTINESFLVKFKDVEMDLFWNNDVYRLNTQVITTAFRVFDSSKIEYVFHTDLEARKKTLRKDEVFLELSNLSKEDFSELSTKNCILPPKSTFFVPKFPSFLIFKKYK